MHSSNFVSCWKDKNEGWNERYCLPTVWCIFAVLMPTVAVDKIKLETRAVEARYGAGCWRRVAARYGMFNAPAAVSHVIVSPAIRRATYQGPRPTWPYLNTCRRQMHSTWIFVCLSMWHVSLNALTLPISQSAFAAVSHFVITKQNYSLPLA